MKIFYSFILTLLFTTMQSQDFYDLETIQSIEVNFAQSNWDQLMDNAYASDAGYIMAESITINGITFDSVGVKYKGNSTYNANQAKNPWHIELDTYKDNEYDGYTDIKLANVSKDPSFLRDVLGYQILRQYMEAPQANFANLYVNGSLIGLYSNTESISKKFMESRFGSKNNTRFKCSPPDGAGPQSNDLPDLVYLGQDSTDYYDGYELKSDAGWQELIDLCDTLTNHTEHIEEMVDINKILWMLAFNNTIVNLDSYIGNFAQNYYLYRSDYGQFMPIVWDLNESFGVFSQTGSINLNGTSAKQTMTHLLHENDNDYPLIQELLSIPRYKRIYLAHMKTILLENFDNGSYAEKGLALQNTIADAVQADNNKFFSYTNFISNLDNDINGGGGGPGGGNSTPGITNLMDTRSEYLLGLSDFTQSEPTISNITLSTTSPVINQNLTITASVSESNTVMIGYRNSSKTAPFTQLEMFDDGAHGDGSAGDGVFGVELSISNAATEYYIYAENDNIGMFSPRRAEFEFYDIEASVNESTDSVVINEFMASNDATITDQDGEFEDWIELYNNSTESIDLGGYLLSDDSEDPGQWVFPEGTVIEANAYLIVWADNDEDQEGLHANFKLSGSGESVVLSSPDFTIINSIDYTEQVADISFARIPNGTGDFESSVSTFNESNDNEIDCTSAGGDMDNDGICADYDCDDNDESIGAAQDEGTTCDDGDSTTTNDVILEDGCTCMGTSVQLTDVVINEFMASNDQTAADQDGEFEDWIELYNNGSESIDLAGYFLSDDSDDLGQWSFPAGTSIEANGFLIIWADNDEDQEGLHANFKLSSSEGSIILSSHTDTIMVDAINYLEQTTDVSFARIPNGTGDFQATVSTFNANNDDAIDCTNAGGDNDNDGICADEDCDDNDASIGAAQTPGIACDDNDVSTENDIIQKDGCTCIGTEIAPNDIVINEFMTSNETIVSDQDEEFDDWIELYNNGTESVDLTGYYLTDDSEDLTQWPFPQSSTIAPGGYLIIWADNDEEQEGLHSNFKLSESGESVILVDPNGTSVIDAIEYPEQTDDISYGRYPNGTGDFQTMIPSFNAENNMTVSTESVIINDTEFKIYPNPTENYFFIEYSKNISKEKAISIYNMNGKVVYQHNIFGKTNINTSDWASGIYIIKSEGSIKKLMVH